MDSENSTLTQQTDDSENEDMQARNLPDDGATEPEVAAAQAAANDGDAEPEHADDPRAAAMEAVVSSRARVEQEELDAYRKDMQAQGLLPADDAPQAKNGDDAEADAQPDAQDAMQRELQAGRVIDNLDGVRVRIKVDGEEREVALADVVRTAQKHEAADARLQEASRLLENARAQAQQAQQQAQSQQMEQPTTDNAQKARNDREQQAKELIEAMFHGDEKQAAQVISELLHNDLPAKDGVNQQPDTEQIAQQVEESLARRNALREFATVYPEVLKDPDLATLADMKLARRISQGEAFSQALMQVGDEIYTKTGLKTSATTQASQASIPTQTERVERKRQTDFVRSRSASSASTQDKPESAADIVQGMMNQRARGRWQPTT